MYVQYNMMQFVDPNWIHFPIGKGNRNSACWKHPKHPLPHLPNSHICLPPFQRRGAYHGLGWRRPAEFSDRDLAGAVALCRRYMCGAAEEVPFDGLLHVVGECHYAARLPDATDRGCGVRGPRLCVQAIQERALALSGRTLDARLSLDVQGAREEPPQLLTYRGCPTCLSEFLCTHILSCHAMTRLRLQEGVL